VRTITFRSHCTTRDRERNPSGLAGVKLLSVMRFAFAAIVFAAAVAAGGCGGSASAPSPGAVVTFTVSGETFRVSLTSDAQIAAARAAERGGPAKIPNGRIV